MPQMKIPNKITYFDQKGITVKKALAGRANSTFFVTHPKYSYDVVMTVGSHELGQCGVGDPIGEGVTISSPLLLPLKNVKNIATALDHTLVLDHNGLVLFSSFILLY